jgi:hypothetical protein
MNESDFTVIKYKPEMFIGQLVDFSGPRAGLLHFARARGARILADITKINNK